MSVADIFSRHRSERRTTLIPFVTAGYPSLEATASVIGAFEQTLGPTVVELGIPFSDPIADGPVTAASMHEALQGGVTPQRIFDMVRTVRPDTGHALMAMVSASIVQRMGPEEFMRRAAESGFDGVIVPDLDVAAGETGEDRTFADHAARHGLSFTLLIAPTTPPDRVGQIVSRCTGFVYVVARVGITGERVALPDVSPRVEALRRVTDLPIAVGFGISQPQQVAQATAVADAAIVGSAIVRRMGRADDPAAAAAELAGELAAGLSGRDGPAVGGKPRGNEESAAPAS